MAFVQNGDKELVGVIAQLITPRPNAKAILALRMSIEIFLKALLIQERNLGDKHLKRLSHKLEDIAGECCSVTGTTEFSDIERLWLDFRKSLRDMTVKKSPCKKYGTQRWLLKQRQLR